MDMLCGAWPPRCGSASYVDIAPVHQSLHKKQAVLRQAAGWALVAPLRAGPIGTRLCGSLHLYPAPQYVVLPEGGGTALRGDPRRAGGRSMQDPASELPTCLTPGRSLVVSRAAKLLGYRLYRDG